MIIRKDFHLRYGARPYRGDDDVELSIAPFPLDTLAIPVIHLGMVVLRLEPVVLAQYLRNILAAGAGQAIDDASLARKVLYDVLCDLFNALLLPLRPHLVVEVLAVEGEPELRAVGHIQAAQYVTLDLRVCGSSQRADGRFRVLLPDIRKFRVLQEPRVSQQDVTIVEMTRTESRNRLPQSVMQCASSMTKRMSCPRS